MDYISGSTHFFSRSPTPTKLASGFECLKNCSGCGTCLENKCVCLIHFMGDNCQEVNKPYYIAFGTIFFTLCIVSFIQLLICIRSEYMKEKNRSMLKVFKLSAQKLLYILVICASAIRGVYFLTKWDVSDFVASHLWTAYFPFIITGMSLLTCFWAEVFHLDDIVLDQPRLLSKSKIGFIAFNLFTYTLFCGQLLAGDFIQDATVNKRIDRICNTGFAFLMIIVVVFFLVYGVEVYFKVRGAFIESQCNVDLWQLHMSRLGLTAQASLQLITALCLLVEVYKEVWKDKLPVFTQNFYDIGYRIVEFGITVWFPCVLWNSSHPEKLWVLNPKRIFKTIQQNQVKRSEQEHIRDANAKNYSSMTDTVKHECWICFDTERTDAGPLIQPCGCKGDVSSVHHDCLKKWLIESTDRENNLSCTVCKQQYQMRQTSFFFLHGKPVHWLQTFTIIIILVGCPLGLYVLWNSLSQTYQHILAMGLTALIEITLLRLLRASFADLWQKAKISSMRILGKTPKKERSLSPAIFTTPDIRTP